MMSHDVGLDEGEGTYHAGVHAGHHGGQTGAGGQGLHLQVA